ncbi:MAG: hypothetical protein WC897_03915 [Candidatus Gracilibacteria bacterium]
MYKFYGIWIDHAHAFIVQANKLGEMTIEKFGSDVEGKNHGGETLEHFTIVNQNQHNERRHNELNAFCKELIKHVTDADELVIFGPSTAKFDLEKEVKEVKALAPKLKGVETTDKLSEAELKDFVKKFFAL